LSEIELCSHAKLNLGLCLIGKRGDGYHELETLMHEISLHDQIKLKANSKTELWVGGKRWDENEGKNSVLQAKALCDDLLGHSCGEWLIDLNKSIPVGSGMGGGSSNAVTMLCYIQKLWPEQITVQHVEQMAASLGSDTNFFIQGGSSLCRGRGEWVEPVAARKFYFNLMFPNLICLTPKVFARVKPKYVAPLEWTLFWNQDRIEKTRNDLEEACLEAYPRMQELMTSIRSLYPNVNLSGSGSTLFTIHQQKLERDLVFQHLSAKLGSQLTLEKAHSYLRA